MNSKLLLLGTVGLSAGLVAACHNGDNSGPAPTPPATSTTQSLDTAQVLALAQKTSETSYPIVVIDGGVTLNDTSETSTPIAVSAM